MSKGEVFTVDLSDFEVLIALFLGSDSPFEVCEVTVVDDGIDVGGAVQDREVLMGDEQGRFGVGQVLLIE